MIVVVAGMQRSGSTFSYNVARELLDKRGGVSNFASVSLNEALLVSTCTKHTIIKTHSPDELVNSLLRKDGLPCICSIRKPEDAIASWVNVFGFSIEESLVTYKEWLIWHQSMSKHMLNLRYEEIDQFSFLAIRKISRYLLNEWGVIEAGKIWQEYRKSSVDKQTKKLQKNDEDSTDIGFSYYNNSTFFHRNHISSLKSRPAKDSLSMEQVGFIRSELKQFIDNDGNYHW